MKVWVDDLFPPFEKSLFYNAGLPENDGTWHWVKSVEQLHHFLDRHPAAVTHLALDNDLGYGRMQEVQFLRDLLGEFAPEYRAVVPEHGEQFLHTTFYPITNNDAVALEMRRLIEDIYRVRS